MGGGGGGGVVVCFYNVYIKIKFVLMGEGLCGLIGTSKIVFSSFEALLVREKCLTAIIYLMCVHFICR